ncbi:unnamed protein product [Onchocerca ochengi]|uniref:NR LBD domain-containing protein n=1 Tax=Onchocerca ochengi TaxID=42157 RepID=A0A182E3F9_ONCOC|nr:unnamed protein product [Onchocerca ochengi]
MCPKKKMNKSCPTRREIHVKELVRANDILEQPLDISTNQKCSNDLSLMDLAGMTDLALRRIINMAKELIFFKGLSSKDQISILKGLSLTVSSSSFLSSF